ncbi:MAG: thiamine diphosphokinase [Lachnospiraceae bacterium]|nr:thiamine diphosphokinase [Lachnospiraceae bacterium]
MKTLIITGGKISADFALTFFENKEYDCVIAADKGLEVLDKICIKPDYIIGDFDSLEAGILSGYSKDRIIKLNPEKDFTDTEAAIRLAIEKGADSVTIIGATGNRLDHVLANISLLMIPLEAGIPAYISDENNRIRLIDKNTELKRENCFGDNVSLIPYSDEVTGVTLKGFYYPLNNKNISRFKELSLGISNKITEDKCIIKIKSGILIMIESRD